MGIGSYGLVVPYRMALEVRSATLRTPGWLAVTILGVAVVSGEIAHRGPTNRLIAVAIVIEVGWLLVNASAA